MVDCRIRVRLRCERRRGRERGKRGALSLVVVSQEDAAADEVMLSSSKRGKERGEKGEEEKGLKQNKKKAKASLRKSTFTQMSRRRVRIEVLAPEHSQKMPLLKQCQIEGADIHRYE